MKRQELIKALEQVGPEFELMVPAICGLERGKQYKIVPVGSVQFYANSKGVGFVLYPEEVNNEST